MSQYYVDLKPKSYSINRFLMKRFTKQISMLFCRIYSDVFSIFHPAVPVQEVVCILKITRKDLLMNWVNLEASESMQVPPGLAPSSKFTPTTGQLDRGFAVASSQQVYRMGVYRSAMSDRLHGDIA